jgi:hypothetical protein
MRLVILSMSLMVGAAAALAETTTEAVPMEKPSPGMPLPIGVGLTYYQQDQPYQLDRLSVNVPGVSLNNLPGVDIQNNTQEYDVQLDYWLLPFMNVFGLIGRIDAETQVDMDLFKGLTIDYDGVVYGAGVTLAGGWKRMFSTLTWTLTETDLEEEDSTVSAWVLTPKVGVSSKYGAAYVGTMYQEVQEDHTGNLTIPVYNEVQYDVRLQQEQNWNVLTGLVTGWGPHWQLNLEAGFVSRQSAIVATTYRF